jgi:PadR family transcriptional regulator PadR
MNLGALEQHVLMAVIALHPSAYGISIQSHITRRAGYEPLLGSVYAALGRLEQKGLITSRPGEITPERGGRRKLYFTITAVGQTTLQGSLKATSLLQRGLRWREAFRSSEAFA